MLQHPVHVCRGYVEDNRKEDAFGSSLRCLMEQVRE